MRNHQHQISKKANVEGVLQKAVNTRKLLNESCRTCSCVVFASIPPTRGAKFVLFLHPRTTEFAKHDVRVDLILTKYTSRAYKSAGNNNL